MFIRVSGIAWGSGKRWFVAGMFQGLPTWTYWEIGWDLTIVRKIFWLSIDMASLSSRFATALLAWALVTSTWCKAALPVPAWKPADLWVVNAEIFPEKAETSLPPRQIFITVFGQSKENGRDCWKVAFGPNGTNPGPVDRYFYVSVDKETMWPRGLMLRILKEPKGTTPSMIKDLEDASMITGAPDGFPLEVFPIDKSLTKQTPGSPFKLVITREEQVAGNQVVVEARLFKDDVEELLVRQKWIPGEKWWREYERCVKGKLVLRATLDKMSEPPKPMDPALAAHLERTKELREDRRLMPTLDIIGVNLPIDDVLERLRSATSVPLTVDPSLSLHDPKYGDWQLHKLPAWRYMDIVAQEQLVDGRWVKDGEGYRLIATTSLREKPPVPVPAPRSFLLYGVLGAILLLHLGFLVIRRQKVAVAEGPSFEATSVSGPISSGAMSPGVSDTPPPMTAEATTWSSRPAGSSPISLPASVTQLQEQCRREPDNLSTRRALRQRVREQNPTASRPSLFGALTLAPMRLRLKVAKAFGKHQAVLYLGEKILASKPADAAAPLDMAEAAEAMEKPDLAMWILGQARQQSPRNTRILAELGRLFEQRGNVQQALRFWRNVETLEPNNLEARRKVMDLAALETIDKNIGQEAVRAGERSRSETNPSAIPTHAVDIVQDAAQTPPESAAPVSAPNPQVPQGQRTPEEEALRTRIAADPKRPSGYLDLASYFSQEKRFDKARAVIEAGREATHGHHDVELALGWLNILSLRYQIEGGAEVQNAEARSTLVSQLAEQEVDYYRRKFTHYPLPENRYEFGLRLFRAGHIDEAILELQPVRSHSALAWKALVQLGHCFKGRGNPPLAQRSFEDALRLIPGRELESQKETLFQLALLHRANGEWQKALGYAYEVANLDFGYQEISRLLDELEARVGGGAPPAQ